MSESMEAPRRFRKKPVVIEAMRNEGDNHLAIADWVMRSQAIGPERKIASHAEGPRLTIHTLEGDMIAELGDWIIRGVHGEFYPCKPAIFAASYDEEQK